MIPHFCWICHNLALGMVLLFVKPWRDFRDEVTKPFSPQNLVLQERKERLRKHRLCLILSSGLYLEHTINCLCELIAELDICHDKEATFTICASVFCFIKQCLLQHGVIVKEEACVLIYLILKCHLEKFKGFKCWHLDKIHLQWCLISELHFRKILICVVTSLLIEIIIMSVASLPY